MKREVKIEITLEIDEENMTTLGALKRAVESLDLPGTLKAVRVDAYEATAPLLPWSFNSWSTCPSCGVSYPNDGRFHFCNSTFTCLGGQRG